MSDDLVTFHRAVAKRRGFGSWRAVLLGTEPLFIDNIERGVLRRVTVGHARTKRGALAIARAELAFHGSKFLVSCAPDHRDECKLWYFRRSGQSTA